MIRGNKALFLSFTIHALIAIFAVALYQQWPARQGGEVRYKIALSCLLENAAAVKEACFTEPERIERQKPVAEPMEPVTEKKNVPKPVVAEKQETVQAVKEVVETVEAVTAAEEPAVVSQTVAAEPESVQEDAGETAATASAASTPPAAPSGAIENAEALPAASAEERYLQEHIRQIALLLRENLYYPRIARKRGITGDVTVAFELLTNGEVRNVAVITQAHAILNRAAVMTIERLSGEFPKPDEPLTLQVPINYRLQ
jgi:protein TonB